MNRLVTGIACVFGALFLVWWVWSLVFHDACNSFLIRDLGSCWVANEDPTGGVFATFAAPVAMGLGIVLVWRHWVRGTK